MGINPCFTHQTKLNTFHKVFASVFLKIARTHITVYSPPPLLLQNYCAYFVHCYMCRDMIRVYYVMRVCGVKGFRAFDAMYHWHFMSDSASLEKGTWPCLNKLAETVSPARVYTH